MNSKDNSLITSKKVTAKILRSSKNLSCDCGGMIFSEKMFFKILSSEISPSGKEEMHMIPVIVCDKCGKVLEIFDPQNVIPEELKIYFFSINFSILIKLIAYISI